MYSVPVGEHGDKDVHENDKGEADIQRVDGEHQTHAGLNLLRVFSDALNEVAHTQRGHEDIIDRCTCENILVRGDQHSQGVQGAGERNHREYEHQTEVEDHIFDDDFLQDHEKDVELFGDAAEQHEVRHPAEQENHRRRFEVRLAGRSARVTIVPCETNKQQTPK